MPLWAFKAVQQFLSSMASLLANKNYVDGVKEHFARSWLTQH